MLGLATEFGVSETAGLFINATFGMPFLMVNNFPGGGPTYPMEAPAVRLALQPLPRLTVRTAISQANPFLPDVNQRNLASNFGQSGGLLSLNEVAASWHDGAEFTGLPGTAKAGFWIQRGPTSSDAGGSPFAYPSPSGATYGTGFYAMFEQQLTSPCRTPEPRKLQRWSPFVHGAGERKKMLCREGL
ncbi:MAG: carbohydrate porin [Chthoniobacterales bacterium]|nr:carbohydrate porin [Chthoniobacterales bacterium]